MPVKTLRTEPPRQPAVKTQRSDEPPPVQPTNIDPLQYMQVMFAKQASATDVVYKALNSKSKTRGELNEKLETLETLRGGDLDAATMRMLGRLDKQDSLLLLRLKTIEKDGGRQRQ